MRIAIDCRKLRDLGIGTYIENLVASLRRMDAENEYVLLGYERDAGWLRSHFEHVTVKSRPYGLRELIEISRAVRAARADLFHSPHYVLPYLLPCPAVTTVHDIIHVMFPEQVPGTPARVYARYFVRRALRASAAVITVSDASRADILALYPWASDRVHRVYNGVDPAFSPSVNNGQPERKFLLYVGNDKPHKDLAVLRQAFAIVTAKRTDVELHMAGYEGGPPETQSNIRRPGYVDKAHLAELYRTATAVICPSRYEGFGLTAVEAQASGCPVVASGIPVFREILGDSALFFQQGKASELAETIETLLADPALRSRLTAAGLANSRRFCFERCARETLDIYRLAASR